MRGGGEGARGEKRRKTPDKDPFPHARSPVSFLDTRLNTKGTPRKSRVGLVWFLP